MYLLIDDLRNTPTDFIARTAEAGKISLKSLHPVLTHVVFDHDLGEEETGYDVMMWALNNSVMPPNVQLVTSNPVGRDNMIAALLNAGYKQKSLVEYYIEV